jgi:hypothetical protein
MRGRETFLSAGGENLTLIPCLNEHPAWLHALETMVSQRWPDAVAEAPPRPEKNQQLVT